MLQVAWQEFAALSMLPFYAPCPTSHTSLQYARTAALYMLPSLAQAYLEAQNRNLMLGSWP